jgi:hypothetical protein
VILASASNEKNEGFAVLNMRQLVKCGSVIAAAALGVVGTAPNAGASVWTSTETVNNCPAAFCLVLFHNSSYGGSRTNFVKSGPSEEGFYNLGPYTFLTAGAGQGESVKNNAASAHARFGSLGSNATIYFSSGYVGPCDRLQAGGEVVYVSRLVNTYNENASIYFRTEVVAQGCRYWS